MRVRTLMYLSHLSRLLILLLVFCLYHMYGDREGREGGISNEEPRVTHDVETINPGTHTHTSSLSSCFSLSCVRGVAVLLFHPWVF